VPLIPLSLRGLQHVTCCFISNTHIQLITNTAISRLYRLLFPTLLFLLHGRYFKGIVTPVNSSLHPSKYPLVFIISLFQNQLAVPSTRKFYSMPSAIKILIFIFLFFYFSSVKIFIVTKIFF
jgi:hypothetical protein